jgi:hypothetical protein
MGSRNDRKSILGIDTEHVGCFRNHIRKSGGELTCCLDHLSDPLVSIRKVQLIAHKVVLRLDGTDMVFQVYLYLLVS